jgi:hypothetical protein
MAQRLNRKVKLVLMTSGGGEASLVSYRLFNQRAKERKPLDPKLDVKNMSAEDYAKARARLLALHKQRFDHGEKS